MSLSERSAAFEIAYSRRPDTPQELMTSKFISPWTTNLPSPKVVLDIGCGQGIEAKMFQESGIDTIGIDLSAEMLRESYHETVVQATGTNLPFGDNVFSGVLVKDMYVFMSPENRLKMLSDARRVLRDNGSILLITQFQPRMRFWVDPPKGLAFNESFEDNNNWQAVVKEHERYGSIESLEFQTTPQLLTEEAAAVGLESRILCLEEWDSNLTKESRWVHRLGTFVAELKPC